MWTKIKERLSNLFDLVTSKKALVGIAACVVLVMVTSVPKIIAIGVVAVSYILAQGFVDAKKEYVKSKTAKK